MNVQDILRESVTPRATDISDRIRLEIPVAIGERKQQLIEWAFVIDMTLAWGTDFSAEEHAEWLEKLG